MRHLTLFNGTASVEYGTVEQFNYLLILEMALIFLSYVVDGFSLWLTVKTNSYHPNLKMLFKTLYYQYFIQMFARLIQIFKMYNLNDEHLNNDLIFDIASFTRNWLVFIALYFGVFVMIERVLATYYIEDYECKPRSYIGYGITIIMHLWCITSALLFIFDVFSVWYHIASFLLANILAFIICVLVGNHNERILDERFRNIKNEECPYTLSKRYQLEENIKTAAFFKKGFTCIILFSIICSSLISVELVPGNPPLKNWLHIAFNFACISYGLSVPFMMHTGNDKSYNELSRIYRKVFCKKNLVNEEPRKVFRDRYGRDLITSREEEKNVYFNNLTKNWKISTEIPEEQDNNKNQVKKPYLIQEKRLSTCSTT